MNDEEKQSLLRDFVLGRLTPEESLRILDELEKDPEASSQVNFYAQLLAFARGDGRDLFRGPVPRPEGVTEKAAGFVRRFSGAIHLMRPVYRFVLFAVVVLAGAGLVGGSRFLANKYDKLARVEGVEFRMNVRALAADDIDTAQRLFQSGDYGTALNVLQRHIRAYPSSQFADYVHYTSGAILLVDARWELAGVFPRFDRAEVLHGIEELTAAIQMSSNARLVEEAHWLRAKAYLMLGQVADCQDELRRVVTMSGAREGEASQLLSDLAGMD